MDVEDGPGVHPGGVGRGGAQAGAPGTATGAVHAALLWLTATGHIPAAIAGTAFIAVQTSQRLLTGVVQGANAAYRTGLYMAEWANFLTDTSTHTATPGSTEPVPDYRGLLILVCLPAYSAVHPGLPLTSAQHVVAEEVSAPVE
ncbi:hypothetical protein [Streptomyces scopuliridis]|uniref:hypothetical protein n=1 Tax=Streptomyces scopuliridis TaxID=452529 RepID=UPI00344330A4